MTSKESAQDKELLERYRRASDTEAAAPSEAVRAAILAEGRRAAELRAKEVRGQPFDASRPAANDSRWKITAFGTAGAALVAALLFAPRLWENAPPPPPASNTARPPKLESLQATPNSSEPLQEIVVTQATRQSSKAAGAASPKLSAPAAQARPADEIAAPKATEVKPRMDLPPPERQRTEALAQSAAPEEKIYPQNYVPAAPPAVPIAPAPQIASLASSQNAARVASLRSAPQPAALQSAAASGDTAQTTALLDQGAALDVRDEHGRTPLMLAVMQGRLDVVRLLLNRGADPNIADSAGRTPLQQAKQENLREVAVLLERAGAR
jgi:Ankyrin repeats (many copies)